MTMQCPKCAQPMFFTGEMHPTIVPQRYYACINRHMVLRYDAHEVDWGDRTITKRWIAEYKTDAVLEYEFVGKVPRAFAQGPD